MAWSMGNGSHNNLSPLPDEGDNLHVQEKQQNCVDYEPRCEEKLCKFLVCHQLPVADAISCFNFSHDQIDNSKDQENHGHSNHKSFHSISLNAFVIDIELSYENKSFYGNEMIHTTSKPLV